MAKTTSLILYTRYACWVYISYCYDTVTAICYELNFILFEKLQNQQVDLSVNDFAVKDTLFNIISINKS